MEYTSYLTSSAPNQGVGRSTQIVSILKEYKSEVPVGFVAGLLSTNVTDLEKHLKELESEGVIRRNGDRISLITER